MQNSQNFSSQGFNAIAFVDYKPAELKINKQWLVVYYTKHPITGELDRFRVTVPVMKNRAQRVIHGKEIALGINEKLKKGWLPYYSETGSNEFKTFEFCKAQFLEQTKKEIAKNSKRPDTLRTYTSNLNMISTYVREKKVKLNMVLEFNTSFVVNFLDYVFFERNNSARTHNNHLRFIATFVNYCKSRGYLKENFVSAITKKREDEKIRQILTPEIKNKLKDSKKENKNYYTLCMATYFCFLRRTELTKLNVCDVNIEKNYIYISREKSKNRKDEHITIPTAYLEMIKAHVQNAKPDDYLFSNNNFATGKIQLNPKKVSDTWAKFRVQKNVETIYQFYSLKDTGITDLLNCGIPAIKVRDQARHYDLRITESYTARNKNCDEIVRNSNFEF